jgi:hypothetical protein
MTHKTHFQRLKEIELGMSIEAFILDYKERGESRISAARRAGIPPPTLKMWESQLIEERRTYHVKESEAVSA